MRNIHYPFSKLVIAMPLTATKWSGNARLQAASRNLPPLKRGESDHEAVKLLQEALMSAGFSIPSGPTGNYLNETAAAVRKCEDRFRLSRDEGVAGNEVLSILDDILNGAPPAPPRPAPPARLTGAALAKVDAPFAKSKVRKAIEAMADVIDAFKSNSAPQPGERPRRLDPVTVEALRVHFKLVFPDSGGASGPPNRTLTLADLELVHKTFEKIEATIVANATQFADGSPKDKKGVLVVAAAPLGGPIQFSSLFRGFTAPDGEMIGPNSRAAVIIHEATHVIDAASGNDDTTHISEFDTRYAQQPADHAIHNPSAYASFAAHIVLGKDPPRRFGLGPGQSL